MVIEKRVEQIIQITAMVLLAIGCLVVLRPFLGAILAAAILCYSTWPIYCFIEQRVGGRAWLAALVMTLLILVVLVVPLALIALSFRDDVPQLVEHVRDTLSHGLPPPPEWVMGLPLVGEYLDAEWREIAESPGQLAEMLKRFAVPARECAVTPGLVIAEGVLLFTLIACVRYFFYRDGLVLISALRNGL